MFKPSRRYRIPSSQQLSLLRELLACQVEGGHGYRLMQATGVRQATLYGLLKRLYDDGYLSRSTQTVEGRQRVCYRLTPAGVHHAERALLEAELEAGIRGLPLESL